MKRILLLITVLTMMIGCSKQQPAPPKARELLKEIVIEHSKTDSAYRYYGYMKEVYRIYNCTYKEVKCKEVRTPDMRYGTCYYYNDFGDIVRIRYIDYTNYPRREE